jgi:thiamine pyrophosphokinase
MIVLILANGELEKSPTLLQLAKDADLVIAADGGARHCKVLERLPDTLIGDLDSIPQELLKEFETRDIEILQHPVRKNATDLELALDHAIKRGATQIYFAGMLGGRWDMSLSNIFLLAQDKYEKIRLSILSNDCFLHILHPGKHSYTTKIGQRVSLIPLKGDGQNITLTGFEYPLDQYTIPFGSSRGLSNVTSSTTVHIQHTNGVLLILFFYPE